MSGELQPLGAMGIACAKLARMTALSDRFMTVTNTNNYDQAKTFVHRKNVLGIKKPPFAIISQLDRHTLELVAGGDHNYFLDSGDLFLSLYIITPTEYYSDNVQAETYADNFFSPVIKEIAQLANADDDDTDNQVVSGEGHLDIRGFDRLVFSENDKDNWESLGRFWIAYYRVSWGGA